MGGSRNGCSLGTPHTLDRIRKVGTFLSFLLYKKSSFAKEIVMKRLSIALILLLTFVGCSTKGAKSFSEIGEPDAFCEVVKKPDPLLMGTWEGRYTRDADISDLDKNYIKYRLIEYQGKYRLRRARRRRWPGGLR